MLGDIGISPLYALKECFSGAHGAPLTPAKLMSVLSLLFWALALVVSTKYVTFVMRADNGGEGGILALLALAQRLTTDRPWFSGAFSLTQQAIRLGYLPRLGIRHTSASERGQIYIPIINWMLLLVLGFRSS